MRAKDMTPQEVRADIEERRKTSKNRTRRNFTDEEIKEAAKFICNKDKKSK